MTFKSASLKNPMLRHPDEVAGSTFDNANQEVYQYVQFNNIQVPEIQNWEAGNEYELIIKVNMEKRIDSSQNQVVGSFKILQVKAREDAKAEKLTREQKRYKKILE